ncbi:stimulated by retinoic acid gene 6 protein-like [Physella acuta]|uniref:stimulated by retinoic acid gene 6 protein-like n=1 Tax=Physella acuta TaxID=109671 RepID=UPI0027DB734E|nr:stimulated by retinoic acid gene 6 protein-like [Physella acuta]
MALDESHHFMLIPALFILAVLAFLEKRQRRVDICRGRPGLIVAIPWLDSYENRFPYSVIFGIVLALLLQLLSETKNIPFYVIALYLQAQALEVCLLCFPFFACISSTYRALGAVLCVVYSIIWSFVFIGKPLIQMTDAEYNNTTALVIVTEVSPLLCHVALIVYCLYIVYRCVHTKNYYTKRQLGDAKPHQMAHVQWVLRKSKDKAVLCYGSGETFVSHMRKSKRLRLFTSLPFFKYPTKICALAFFQLCVIYLITLVFIFLIVSVNSPFLNFLSELFQTKLFKDQEIILKSSMAASLVVTDIITVLHIFMTLRNYRYHTLKLYQGEIHNLQQPYISTTEALHQNMRFAGNQLAFMLWGMILLFVIFTLTTLAVAEIIYYIKKKDLWAEKVKQFFIALCFPLTMLVLNYIQRFVCRRFLLQGKISTTDKHSPLNVNNRKFYELFHYYSLFSNFGIGLFSCLRRVLWSAALGAMSMGRLDRSIFPRDMLSYDSGYLAYVSMLYVDNAHNNPSMRVFIHLINVNRKSRSPTSETSQLPPVLASDVSQDGATVCEISSVSLEEDKKTRLARIRWFLAYTLFHNPQLRGLRKNKLTKSLLVTNGLTQFPDTSAAARYNLQDLGGEISQDTNLSAV